SWFGNPNPGYLSSTTALNLFSVQYWNPAWEQEAFKQIDAMIAEGFDGVFLDVLSGDSEWQSGNDEHNPTVSNATQYLAQLVSDIAAHIKNQKLTRPFYLFGNNPYTMAAQIPASLANLDGIVNEVVYYGQPVNNGLISQLQSLNYPGYDPV